MSPLLLALSAAAAPVSVSWPTSQPVLYHLETQLLTPRAVRYYGAENLDARVLAVQIGTDATCNAKAEGKGWRVRCDLTWLRIAGRAADPAEQTKTDRIFEEWSKNLAGADVEFVIAKDGRFKEFDLLPNQQQRTRTEGYVIESQRTLLQRMFCAFDMPIPEGDDDWTRGWQQKNTSALMQLQVISGTVGSSVIEHKRAADAWGLVAVVSGGRGMLTPGGALDAGTKLVDVRVDSEALYEPGAGPIVYRDFTLDGRLTSSSHETGTNAEFFQASALQKVDAFSGDGTPPLPISALRSPKLDVAPDPLPEGVALVPFDELGMQPLFVQGMPEGAKELGFPKTPVTARVLVGPDGKPTSVKATKGYAALAVSTQNALENATFPSRGAAYAVDVDVEWRP